MNKRFVATLALLAISAGTEVTARAAVPRQVFVADGARTPDLFIQSSFDDAAQEKVLTELRRALKASTGFDPLFHRFEKALAVEAKINTKMNDLVKEMIQKLVNMKFDMLDAKILIEGLHYQTPEATLRIGSATARPDGIDLPVSIRLRQTVVTADRIRITFVPHMKTPSFLDEFYIVLRGANLKSKSLDSLALDLTINARTAPDGSTTFTLPKTSFSSYESIDPEQLKDELILDPGEVEIPYLSMNFGRTSLPARVEGLKEVLRRRNVQLAELVFKPLVAEIKKVPEKVFKSKKTSMVMPKEAEFDIPCLGKTSLKLLQYGQIGTSQLMLAFGFSHPEYPADSKSPSEFADSGDALHDRISQKNVTAAFGVRDRFIAWALEKALRGCMKDKIPPALRLGPAGVHARMGREDGGDGVLALHAQAGIKGLVRAVLGSPIIEFPIKVSPKLQFRSGGAEPAMIVLDMTNPDLSDEVLRSGFDGIPSNLEKLRLKKKVIKKIRAQLTEALGKAKVEIPLKFLESPDVSYANIESDRHGHLDLLLTLDPSRQPGAANFWTNLSPYLNKIFVSKEKSRK